MAAYWEPHQDRLMPKGERLPRWISIPIILGLSGALWALVIVLVCAIR